MSCIIIAEVGINHNGDMKLAGDLIHAAKIAGADVVKFQNYNTDDFISDKNLQYSYTVEGKEITESQYDMFKRYELSDTQLLELAGICKQEDILFSSTPTSEEGIGILQRAGAAYLKNGSDYLAHLPLIQTMAETGIPTILSTGMATLAEIDDAVHVFYSAGGENLTLLHCTSAYPTPDGDTNLRKIPTLQAAFGCKVGFSDHTEGTIAAIGAVILGACIIEKHFTFDKKLPGPDHYFSSDPEEMKTLVKAIRTIEKQLGDSSIGFTEQEEESRRQFTLSCVAGSDLPAGHVIGSDDIKYRRPGTGLRQKYAEWLIGRKLQYDVSKGHLFQKENFL
jgi:N-acetylneuraminate synthase/N,N'-diacetyllegionaminate synthase